jgi:hypothetical protein
MNGYYSYRLVYQEWFITTLRGCGGPRKPLERPPLEAGCAAAPITYCGPALLSIRALSVDVRPDDLHYIRATNRTCNNIYRLLVLAGYRLVN